MATIVERAAWRGVLILVVLAVVAAGCGSAGSASPGTSAIASPSGAGPTAGVPTPSTPASSVPDPGGTIPPGRSIADGSGGPATYTFREEWRKALERAQAWRSGAYLISAACQDVNDDGVPSHWALVFIDRTDADAVLRLEIDPWGKVTGTMELTGDAVGSFVDRFTKRIPFAVIDSDTAVATGRTVLAAQLVLTKTKDHMLSLSHWPNHDGALDWVFTVFDTHTANYASVTIDALSGTVIPPG
jgi:hypothetical protein